MSDSESDSGSQLWEVLDIVGQRTSASGIVEVLVMWKASWIPKHNLAPGQVLANWNDTLKTRQDVLIESQFCPKVESKRVRK